MPEIVGLLCSYKTNNLHIFRTETFYHLNPKLPLTSNATTRKDINILTPSMDPIDFPNQIIARDVPELKIADLGFRNAEWSTEEMEYWSNGMLEYCELTCWIVTYFRMALLNAAMWTSPAK